MAEHVEGAVPEPVGDSQGRLWTLLWGFLGTVVWAIVCNSVLDASMWWGHAPRPTLIVQGAAQPAGLLAVWLVLVIGICITGRLWLSLGLLLVCACTVAAINAVKMSILQEPLFPSDTAFLSSPGFLMSMVPLRSVVLGALGAAATIVVFVGVGKVMARRFPRIGKADAGRAGRSILLGRVVIVVLATTLLLDTVNFNQPGNIWRRVYGAQGVDWIAWGQSVNYARNGFVGGFLYNMPIEAMARPVGYGKQTMADIAHRYSASAAVRNAGRDRHALDDVNVVLVLSESFADPAELSGVHLARDPMPSTRRIMRDSWSGKTLASFYGGGTSSMEFQALTGQNVGLFNPQISSPYQMVVPNYDSYPSAVGWFNAHGHKSIAIHPYSTEMYRRRAVYETFGFANFIHDSTMQVASKLGTHGYISDESAFDEVLYQLDTSASPLLVNLVTMQNHVPVTDWPDAPIPASGDLNSGEAERVGGYARGIEYSDAALDSFLARLQARDEDTVVVFYGDHFPGIFDDDILQQNEGLSRYSTPLFLWSSQGNAHRDLPISSPVQFLPYLFDLLHAPLPPYYELLREVAKNVGAIGPGRIVSPSGQEIAETSLSAKGKALLRDYRMVQYDFSLGERYAVGSMWY